MKFILIILILFPGALYAQLPCPTWGNASKGTLAYSLNLKKNRTDIPLSYKQISITDFLNFQDDSIGDSVAYEMTGGYVVDVKKTRL